MKIIIFLIFAMALTDAHAVAPIETMKNVGRNIEHINLLRKELLAPPSYGARSPDIIRKEILDNVGRIYNTILDDDILRRIDGPVVSNLRDWALDYSNLKGLDVTYIENIVFIPEEEVIICKKHVCGYQIIPAHYGPTYNLESDEAKLNRLRKNFEGFNELNASIIH